MSQIRKAHSVEIIDKRLRQLETSGQLDVMELVGMHDEMARVERKRLAKVAELAAGKTRSRPLANLQTHNDRFERLTRLVEAAMRKPVVDSSEHKLLESVAAALRQRKEITEA